MEKAQNRRRIGLNVGIGIGFAMLYFGIAKTSSMKREEKLKKSEENSEFPE